MLKLKELIIIIVIVAICEGEASFQATRYIIYYYRPVQPNLEFPYNISVKENSKLGCTGLYYSNLNKV